jgi:iduronate 2-sulfatase
MAVTSLFRWKFTRGSKFKNWNLLCKQKMRNYFYLLMGLLAVQIPLHAQSTHLNVVFISIDDMRPDIGAYGDSFAKTPNIDKLAAEGTLFNKAYIQQAVCGPSRASMMTGLRPDQIGVWDLGTHFRENVPHVITLPQYFKNHGYHAREVGKIYHDPARAKDPVSWSGPSRLHVTKNLPGHKYVLPKNITNNNGWKAAASEMADVPDSAYIDGKVADTAIEMLNEIKDSTFFLAIGFRRPHLPFSAPQKYWNLYDRAKIPLPENPLPPSGVPEFSLHNWTELRGYTDIHKEDALSEEKIKELKHGYYASISYVDALIGKLIDELERLNLKEETIIVLWSDHGFHLGEHGLWTKTTNYELDTRIPLIISIPGQQFTGSKIEAIVESVDVYPTLADVAGLPIPEGLAGKSLKPFIENPETVWDKPALSQFPWPWFYKNKPKVMGYAIRTRDYRYIQWNDFASGEIVARELYDHDKDPFETQNIAFKKSNKEILEKMEQKLKKAYSEGFIQGFTKSYNSLEKHD